MIRDINLSKIFLLMIGFGYLVLLLIIRDCLIISKKELNVYYYNETIGFKKTKH